MKHLMHDGVNVQYFIVRIPHQRFVLVYYQLWTITTCDCG